MNKLEEIRDNLAVVRRVEENAEAWIYNQLSESPKEDIKFATETAVDFWKGGFDAAIALGLPVKFTEWKDRYVESIVKYESELFSYEFWDENEELIKFEDAEELYQYWITHILKIE